MTLQAGHSLSYIITSINPANVVIGSCGNYGNLELGISFFPIGLCPEILDDTDECQYILEHKILLQLKLYHCYSLLSTYIQQNNQKVGQKFTNKIAFPVGDVTFPIFDVLCQNPKFPNGISQILLCRTVGKFGISAIPTTPESHIRTSLGHALSYGGP